MTVLTPANARNFAGLRISSSSDTKAAAICMGIYGSAGSGKTSLMADVVNSEHGTPALLVDIEAGSSSVQHLLDKGLDVVQVSKWTEVLNIRRELNKEGHPYKSIIWDNISEMASMCLRHVSAGVPIPQIQHYGQSTANMMEFVREQRDFARLDGVNTLMVLWEELEREELTGLVRKKVNLTPKLAAAVPGIITQIGRLTVPGKAKDNYIRQLSFAPSQDSDSKFRVAPTEAAANIPLELWLRKDTHFLVDFLATIKDGTPFPTAKYAAPARPTTS